MQLRRGALLSRRSLYHQIKDDPRFMTANVIVIVTPAGSFTYKDRWGIPERDTPWLKEQLEGHIEYFKDRERSVRL